MKVGIGAITDVGQVREVNEDSLLVDNDLFIFAVADGMGGHNAGEIASATALETIRASIASGLDIEAAIKKANKSVIQKAGSDKEFSGMGTTITVLGFSKDGELSIAHVGDSRAYVVHRSLDNAVAKDSQRTDTELVRLTKDHSLVEELVQAGQITEEEANVHPRRSVITRALGIENEVEVDVSPIPFYQDDRYLLCSDGLTSMVRDEEILQILKSFESPKDCAAELIARANAKGGSDNITVIVLDVLNPKIEIPEKIKVAISQSSPDVTIPRSLTSKGRIPFIIRVVLAFTAVIALGYGIYATASYYAHNGYYLDQKNGQVVIMAGHYGGVLFWDPQVDTETGIEYKDLSPADKLLVTRHTRFSTKAQATTRVERARLNIGKSKSSQDPLDYMNTTTTTTTLVVDDPNAIIVPPPTAVGEQ